MVALSFLEKENAMFVRSLKDVEGTDHFVEWGSGTSHRLLTEGDGMGFTVCHTVVRARTVSLIQYRNHLEACYCIGGEGEIEDMKGNVFSIGKGDIYVLDQNDKHYLRGGRDTDLILISIFNPPLKGTERHNLDDPSGSAY
ncbi:Ectoine synthase (plasmid) [Sinorhizobium meliloti AK83]|nr:Ectoine synthase [Sinorhizobium meliloti AK83]AEG58098.1 Ectoine synthase [Sinorhizobium meliloti AK83]SEJ88846.1 ectoine synthase [Sinorhizobium meliloti]